MYCPKATRSFNFHVSGTMPSKISTSNRLGVLKSSIPQIHGFPKQNYQVKLLTIYDAIELLFTQNAFMPRNNTTEFVGVVLIIFSLGHPWWASWEDLKSLHATLTILQLVRIVRCKILCPSKCCANRHSQSRFMVNLPGIKCWQAYKEPAFYSVQLHIRNWWLYPSPTSSDKWKLSILTNTDVKIKQWVCMPGLNQHARFYPVYRLKNHGFLWNHVCHAAQGKRELMSCLDCK